MVKTKVERANARWDRLLRGLPATLPQCARGAHTVSADCPERDAKPCRPAEQDDPEGYLAIVLELAANGHGRALDALDNRLPADAPDSPRYGWTGTIR